jgi:hypothetical protein
MERIFLCTYSMQYTVHTYSKHNVQWDNIMRIQHTVCFVLLYVCMYVHTYIIQTEMLCTVCMYVHSMFVQYVHN